MSSSVRLRALFEDMHFVYAGLGAAAATVSCIAIMLSMMHFAALTNPGFNQNPVVVDARMLMPRVLDQAFDDRRRRRASDDAAFTLSAVVTREGRLVNLELHPEDGQTPAAGSSEARAVENDARGDVAGAVRTGPGGRTAGRGQHGLAGRAHDRARHRRRRKCCRLRRPRRSAAST